MQPVPEHMSCSFCWPSCWIDDETRTPNPAAQWYMMTWRDDERLDELVPAATHAERLAKVAELEKQGKAETADFGKFIHIRLKLGE
jgi:hypothetical protein